MKFFMNLRLMTRKHIEMFEGRDALRATDEKFMNMLVMKETMQWLIY